MDFIPTITLLSKKFKWLNRILGFVSAGLMIAFAILNFSFLGKPINQIIMIFYYLLFAGLLLFSELGFERVLRMFGFLGNLFGKGVFVLLIGISMFGGGFTLKTIIAIVLMICGVLYMLLFFLPNKLLRGASQPNTA